jgi:hypothetical protein
MVAHAVFDAERRRIERNPSRLGTDWSDHTRRELRPRGPRRKPKDLAFAHNSKMFIFHGAVV